MYVSLRVKCPFLVRLQQNWKSLNRVSKNTQILVFMKIPPVDLFHADRQTHTHTRARTHTQTHTRAHARTSTHTQTNVVRTDSETDVTKLIVAFRSFANAPKSFKYYTK